MLLTKTTFRQDKPLTFKLVVVLNAKIPLDLAQTIIPKNWIPIIILKLNRELTKQYQEKAI